MDADLYFDRVRERLVGGTVTDRLLAGNSLSIWVDSKPQTRLGWTISLEPCWHLLGPDRVLAGSRQAQDEEEVDGFQAVAEAIDTLLDRSIEDLDADEQTGDLSVKFSGGVVARTFLTDPRDEFLWRIGSLASEDYIFGTPTGMRIHTQSGGNNNLMWC